MRLPIYDLKAESKVSVALVLITYTFNCLIGVVKLICALLSTNIYEINVQFKNLKTIDILLVRNEIKI